MTEYEVRLYRADGTLSIISRIAADSNGAAEAKALGLLKGNIERAEVWRDGVRISSVGHFENPTNSN